MKKTKNVIGSGAQIHRRSLTDNETVVTRDTIKMVTSWVYRHTYFSDKETVEDIVAYCLEMAWGHWDPNRGVPFVNFIFTRKGNTYLFLSKAIDQQLREHEEKKWWRELPVELTDNENGKEQCIEEYADPKALESQLFQCGEDPSNRYLDAEDISRWFIAQINAYILHLRNTCDFNKLFVLHVMCTKDKRLKSVAIEKGLSHANLTRFVKGIYYDLAERMQISVDRIRNGINIIRSEATLRSQIIQFNSQGLE